MSLDIKIIRLIVIKSLPINYQKRKNIWSSFYTSFEFDVHLFVQNNINNHVTGPICNITHTHRDRHACTHTHTHTHTTLLVICVLAYSYVEQAVNTAHGFVWQSLTACRYQHSVCNGSVQALNWGQDYLVFAQSVLHAVGLGEKSASCLWFVGQVVEPIEMIALQCEDWCGC